MKTLLSPDAKSLNSLLVVCEEFASDHYITYSTAKTQVMLITPGGNSFHNPPNIRLSSTVIEYVNNFKYLGHVVSNNFTDDLDVEREMRNLYIRGNTIARKFSFLSMDTKCSLFKLTVTPFIRAPCGPVIREHLSTK